MSDVRLDVPARIAVLLRKIENGEEIEPPVELAALSRASVEPKLFVICHWKLSAYTDRVPLTAKIPPGADRARPSPLL